MRSVRDGRVMRMSCTWRPMRATTARCVTLSLCAVMLASCSGNAQMHGVMVEPPKDVGSFSFVMPTGARVVAPQVGAPTVLFFGYTHCPDVCPTTLSDWRRAKDKLGAAAASVQFVFVSVDPERDTPVVSDAYAKQFDKTFLGVTGDSATTSRIMTAFGVSAAHEAITDATHYGVAHSAQAFLIDAKGRVIAMYPVGIGWDALAADLKSIL